MYRRPFKRPFILVDMVMFLLIIQGRCIDNYDKINQPFLEEKFSGVPWIYMNPCNVKRQQQRHPRLSNLDALYLNKNFERERERD